MISETRLARSYSSFWRSTAPTMELFVKRCNLAGYERNFEPILSLVDPDRRAITNQIAFELFYSIQGNAADINQVNRDINNSAGVLRAVERLSYDASSISDEEKREASELARRMWLHFNYPVHAAVELKPRFKGCGIILSCAGDALVNRETIVEFKDGDRPFRAYEFRQLSVYAALLYNERRMLPKAIGVLNSRRGVYAGVEFEHFVSQVSGRSGLEYVSEIVDMISEASIP